MATRVREYLRRVFRYGTNDLVPPIDQTATSSVSSPQQLHRELREIPAYPPDAFVAAASLVEQAGAYAWIMPGSEANGSDDPFRIFGENQHELRLAGGAWAFALPHAPSDDLEDQLDKAHEFMARRYQVYADSLISPHNLKLGIKTVSKSQSDKARKRLKSFKLKWYQELWDELLHSNDPIDARPKSGPDGLLVFPDWWSSALRLMIVSDEASAGIGFHPLRDTDDTGAVTREQRPQTSWQDLFMQLFSKQKRVNTIGMAVDEGFACVLPKTRTPEVGCTLRSLSHHLALLPGQAKVSAYWTASSQERPDSSEEFNLLLIPFPYVIPAQSFVSPHKPDVRNDTGKPTWNWFDTKQLWLTEGRTSNPSEGDLHELQSRPADIVRALLDQAVREGRKIHAVVFPEYALNWRTYEEVRNVVMRDENVEILVSGLSEIDLAMSGESISANGHQTAKGNWVAMETKQSDANGNFAANEWAYSHFRRKHHRWRLDPNQLERYAITQNMGLQDFHWENIELGTRDIGLVEFRAGCMLTTLICEDLARIEPCQSTIRALGPNLVLVLLMDGPQILGRWPNQYAGVLADDPGSSVLTFTSYGLIGRGAASDSTGSRSVALWRDGGGGRRELSLPTGSHALVVSIKGSPRNETTLDGRDDAGVSHIWTLKDVSSLSLRPDDNRLRSYVGV